VAAELGVADVNLAGTGVSMGAVWGDYDNDGYEDLFLIKWGGRSCSTTSAASASRASRARRPAAWVNANTAVWLDYDGDGLLDLFVGGYYRETSNLWQLTTTRIMPDSFEYATNGGRKYLFRNLGGGRFEEVSAKVGIDSRRWALAAPRPTCAAPAVPDLFIANDYGVSELYSTTAALPRESAARPASASRRRAA
jgi:hypothetical protein